MLESVGFGLTIASAITSLYSFLQDSSSTLRKKLDSVFQQTRLGVPVYTPHGQEIFLYPIINAEVEYEWGSRFLINLPVGMTSEDMEMKKLAISQALKQDIDMYFENGLILDVFNEPMPRLIEYSYQKREDWKVVVGYNARREPLYYDFAGSFPHLLVAGIPGSGKSVVVRSILTSLILNKHDELELYLSDLKGGVELGLFKDLYCVQDFARSIVELYRMLKTVEQRMNDRYEIMFKMNVRKWTGERIVLVMDELADLKTGESGDPDKKLKASIKTKLRLIAAKGRAAGVYLVLSTQRPSVDVIEGTIRTNIDSAICFRTRDAIQSRTVLDNDDASQLPAIEGRAIYQQKMDDTIQTLFLEDTKAEELLATIPRKEGPYERPDTIQVPTKAVAVDRNIIQLG